MQINCPVCSTIIEVSEEHAGHKGRCISCNAKFLIPTSPDQEIEILEMGELPQAETITNENIETNVSQPVDNKPPVLKMPGASSYVPPKPIVIKKSSSMGGVLVLITLIGLCGLGVYLVSSGKMIKISSGEDQNSKTVITKKIYVNGAGNNDKPSEENLKSTVVDESVPFKMPGPSEEDFELTKEDKDRSLKFLISEELSKREIVYDSFRELGDQFKETYEKLLRQARSKRLSEFSSKVSSLSASEQSSTSFENDYQAWKDASSAALIIVMTKWKEKDPDNLKQRVKEMEDTVKNSQERYKVLTDSLKGNQFEDDESLKGYVGLFSELDSEISWSKGESAFVPAKFNELIALAKPNEDNPDSDVNSLSNLKLVYEKNEAIKSYNEQVNWGTSIYKKLLSEINQRRVALGLIALRIDQELTLASEMHSGDMHFQDFFSHKSFDGSGYAARAKNAGYAGKVYWELLYKLSPEPGEAFKAWWVSDSQRIMMFNKETDSMGVGRVNNYWTVNIGKL